MREKGQIPIGDVVEIGSQGVFGSDSRTFINCVLYGCHYNKIFDNLKTTRLEINEHVSTHLETHSNIITKEVHACERCDKTFYKIEYLEMHMRRNVHKGISIFNFQFQLESDTDSVDSDDSGVIMSYNPSKHPGPIYSFDE